jgi:hypothetical protein
VHACACRAHLTCAAIRLYCLSSELRVVAIILREAPMPAVSFTKGRLASARLS